MPLRIPVLIEFPERDTAIALFLVIEDRTDARVLTEVVRAKGRLGIQQAAAINNLSVSRFSHIFSYQFGMSYRRVEWVVRMELGAHTLISTSWRMSEIADVFQYSHLKKWDTAFHRHFGSSPTQYRTMSRTNPLLFTSGCQFLKTAVEIMRDTGSELNTPSKTARGVPSH